MLVRIIYACLSSFDANPLTSKWNSFSGSLTAFVVMGLIMEYIVVVDYLTVGFLIPPVRSAKAATQRTGNSRDVFQKDGTESADIREV